MKIENKIIKKNLWSVTVDNNTIHVENKINSLELYINNKLQDIYIGTFATQGFHLTGKLDNKKEVKVAWGGDFKIHCYIFVDNELVLASKEEDESI